jgi:hypothetical protein
MKYSIYSTVLMFGLRLVTLNYWLLVISINNYEFIFMF